MPDDPKTENGSDPASRRKTLDLITDFFLPRYWGSALLLFCVWNVVRMGSNGVGVSNLFRDVEEHHIRFWAWESLTSPTAWTSAVLAFAVGLMLVAPLFSWMFVPPSQRKVSVAAMRLLLVVAGGSIYGFLIWSWYRTDGSAFLPGELARAAAGGVLGWLAFALLFAVLAGMMTYFRDHLPPIMEQLRDPSKVQAIQDIIGGGILLKLLPWARIQAQIMQRNMRDTAAAFYFLVMFLAIFAVLTIDTLLPGVALICLLLLIFVFFHALAALTPTLKLAAIGFMGILYLSAFGEQTQGYKLTFDGIVGPEGKDFYESPDQHFDIEARSGVDFDQMARNCDRTAWAGGGIDMATAMNNWLARARVAQGRAKPKMVIVATSGGAYRAGFWTTLILDELIYADRADPQLKGVARGVRFITGASGGMIGAAYFAAMATENGFPYERQLTERQLHTDIARAQLHSDARPEDAAAYHHIVANPFPRDSLTAVAKHIIRTDLPSLLLPGRVSVDRGKVLEKHWRAIDVPFGALRQGEERGWRPSILFSPMLIESSKPLVISNLRVSEIPDARNGEIVEFFRAYPCARASFSMATAARMNATFPYISPAVSLPANPRRRVVDAGYYDNYGIGLAAALLGSDGKKCNYVPAGQPRPDSPDALCMLRQQVGSSTDCTFFPNGRNMRGHRIAFCLSKWLRENTSGVILIEIRAFELGTSSEQTGHCPDRSGTAEQARKHLEFLTSPIDAVLSARGGSMVLRNEQVLRHYGEADDAVPMRRLILVNCVNGGMNWIMPKDELDEMRAQFRHLWDDVAQFSWASVGPDNRIKVETLTAGDFLRRAWNE